MIHSHCFHYVGQQLVVVRDHGRFRPPHIDEHELILESVEKCCKCGKLRPDCSQHPSGFKEQPLPNQLPLLTMPPEP